MRDLGTIPAVNRRLFNVVARASLVLAGVALFICVASHWWNVELIVWHSASYDIRFLSNHGGCAIQRIGPPRAAGFRIAYPATLDVPYPLLFLALVVLSLTALWIDRQAYRRHEAECECVVCGYDLRATPQRCPECGTIAQKPHAV